jgi:hypothetical protein
MRTNHSKFQLFYNYSGLSLANQLAAEVHHSDMRDLPVDGGERLTCDVMQPDHRSFRSDRIEAKAFLRATKLQIEYCLFRVCPPKPLVSRDIMWSIQVEIKR